MRLPLLLLLTSAGCLSPAETRDLVDDDRAKQINRTAEMALFKLKPLIVTVQDNLDAYIERDTDTTGRAIERIAHEALDRDNAIKGSAARHSALTATERATARRDSESRDHALTLNLDRHKAANEGAARSMLADVKIVRMVATTAGVTSSANSGRLFALEKRADAEDADDLSDHQRAIDAMNAGFAKRDADYAKDRKADKAWQASVPADMQDKLLVIAGKLGGAVLLLGAAWAKFRPKK